jgi:hypothetical protein
MNKNPDTGSTEDAQAATDTARALAKLLSFASMYPTDHPLLADAASRALQRTQMDGTDLVIHVQNEALALQGQPVGIEDRETRRLHRHLRAIGIVAVQVDAAATREDLTRFAIAILDAKKEVARSVGFVGVDLSGAFPETVRIQSRGFGARVTDTRSATRQVMSALDDVATAETPAVTRAVQELVPRILEQFDTAAEQDGPGDSNRGLDEVLDLCAVALRAGVQDLLESGGILGDLSSLFEATEKALSDADDLDSAKLMMDVLRRATEEVSQDPTTSPSDAKIAERSIDDGCELSIEQLRMELEEVTRGAAPLEETDEVTEDAETLSILLQLCSRRPPRAVLDQILAILRPGGGALWAEREVRILEGGIIDILLTRDVKLVDATLPTLLYLLRVDSPIQLTKLLANVANVAERSDAASYFWPHLMNEILVGTHVEAHDRIDAHHISELNRLACSFDGNTSQGPFRRLLKLDAIHKRRICEDTLTMRRPEMFPVLASLFKSPLGKRIADMVFRRVRRNPPKWIGSLAIVQTPSLTKDVHQLLHELLSTDGRFESSKRAAEIAATILVRMVAGLPDVRREESWVAESLRAAGLLDPIASDPLLQRVVREKSFLSYDWPKECRQVATQAIDLHKVRGRSRT